MLKTLSLDTLGDLGAGEARAIVDAEIQRAVADLEDRGGEDGKARSVVVQIDLAKKEGLVVAQVSASSKLSPRRNRATASRVGFKNGKEVLVFQDESPDNPDQ